MTRESPSADARLTSTRCAAAQLPRLRAVLDDLVERAEADAAFRATVIADLEAALEREGVEPTPVLVRRLQSRLSS